MKNLSQCARCTVPEEKRICRTPNGKGPSFCPTRLYPELIPAVVEEYQEPQLRHFARMASIQEAECYANRKPGEYVLQPTKPRLQETIEFAKKLNCKKLGIAFCGGVRKEAGLLSDVFEAQGFEVISVACSVGGVPKESLDLQDDQKVQIGTYETMCNPILQAMVLY